MDLIGRLQRRGYSLAGIRDLLDAWTDGADLNEVLEIEPDDLVHVDEPGARVTVAELARVLPALVPGHLDNLLRVGLVDPCGPDAYCIPSPSLLHLSADMLHAGYSPKQLLSLLATINDAATRIADATATLLAKPPKGVSDDAFDRLASRGRGLLANGTGRLTIYSLGKRLAPDAPGRQRTRP